jgi:hypothetical protein
MQQLISAMPWIGAAFAFAAAILWLVSALVKIPDLLTSGIQGPNAVTNILRRQSAWSAGAAVCAALSAAAQGIAMMNHGPC